MSMFNPSEHPTDLFQLPSGDWIEISEVNAVDEDQS